MAIPAVPTNFSVQQGNGQVLISWDHVVGATAYLVKRSTDGITFAALVTSASSPHLDTTVTIGTQYWYQVASTDGVGISPYTTAQSTVPTASGEMSLAELRLRAKQRADRVNSDFVTDEEWNANINLSLQELYDLLVTNYEDQFIAPPAVINLTGVASYALPNGQLSFLNDAGASFVAEPFYKLRGVDLALNNAANAWVTVSKFVFDERNRFIFPNTASTIYGVFNLRYRLLGNNIQFIPVPTVGQRIRLWYIPRLAVLLKDIDLTTVGVSGWLEYVIIDAAIKALQKEESDVSILAAQKSAMIKRVQEAASNRDAARPETIADVRQSGGLGTAASAGYGGGWPGGY